MEAENLNMEEITEARRKAIAASIRVINADELKALGDRVFPLAGDPWREIYFSFLSEHPAATFHHATTHDRIQVVYCNAGNKGMWITPGGGMGPLQPRSLERLKQIVEGR